MTAVIIVFSFPFIIKLFSLNFKGRATQNFIDIDMLQNVKSMLPYRVKNQGNCNYVTLPALMLHELLIFENNY